MTFKLMGIASAIRVASDGIYIQQQHTDLEDHQTELLKALADKIKEMWTLIDEWEKEQEN